MIGKQDNCRRASIDNFSLEGGFNMFMYNLDSYYIMLVLPAVMFALYAQFKVKSTFAKYSRVVNTRGKTGAMVAREILDINGLQHVAVERIPGNLTDHYDPRTQVVRLSDSVHSSQSIAAVGVAAHETGHAVQHSTKYLPLTLRNRFVPVANFGSGLGPWLAILGLFLGMPTLAQIGIILFTAAVAFTIITLPVEFNASRRAISTLANTGILSAQELGPTKKVLGAAALTYIASAAVAIANLLRLVLLTNSRRRD